MSVTTKSEEEEEKEEEEEERRGKAIDTIVESKINISLSVARVVLSTSDRDVFSNLYN